MINLVKLQNLDGKFMKHYWLKLPFKVRMLMVQTNLLFIMKFSIMTLLFDLTASISSIIITKVVNYYYRSNLEDIHFFFTIICKYFAQT